MDLYDNESGQAPPTRPGAPDAAPDDQKENQDNQTTGLLPKEFFGSVDLKVGNTYRVKIAQVLDKEVACVLDDDSAEEKSEAPEGPPPDGGAPMPNSMYE